MEGVIRTVMGAGKKTGKGRRGREEEEEAIYKRVQHFICRGRLQTTDTVGWQGILLCMYGIDGWMGGWMD
jgi:hypothetical protein